MPAALPPVTDCGCSAASSSSSTAACCSTPYGIEDPNAARVVPDDVTIWSEYYQLADLIQGPVQQTWYWNPNLSVWQ
jgi:hypothetical protein